MALDREGGDSDIVLEAGEVACLVLHDIGRDWPHPHLNILGVKGDEGGKKREGRYGSFHVSSSETDGPGKPRA